MTLDSFLHDALHEISRGTKDRRHPYRFVIFNTITDDYPDTRMVVLRRFDRQELKLDIYTDYRSNKIQQLKITPRASILLWHPSKKLQIKLMIDAQLVDGEEREKRYQELPVSGQHGYNTEENPGSPKADLESAHLWRTKYNSDFFSIIRGKIGKIEILQLQGKEHLRASYEFLGTEVTEQHWLVP